MAYLPLLALAMVSSSCNGHDIPEEVTPIFPEQVNETIEPGADYELVINPNLAWEVAISGDTEYFRLISRGEPLPVVSGQAGEHTLVVEAILDESDFEQRQCTLTMTMGQEEKVIAVFTKNGRDRIFNVYPVNIVDGDFEYGDDGYVFSETETSEISLTYKNGDFQTYFKVTANFDWRLKEVPEWVEVNAGVGGYVDASKANVPGVVSLRGVNPKYPVEGGEGKLVFIIDDGSENPAEVEADITLSIGASKDIFEVQMPASAKFNKDGAYFNEMNGEYSENIPLKGSVTGVDGVKVYAVAFDASGCYIVGSSDPAYPVYDWVNISLSEDEDNVLKNREIKVSVKANSGNARSAGILVIPGTVSVTSPEDDILNDSYDDIREEFLQYVYTTLSQEGKSGGSEGGLVSADNASLASKGARFDVLDASSSENEWISIVDEMFNVGTENYYQLTVTKPMGSYQLKFGKELWGALMYEVSDEGFLVESETSWLEPSESSFFITLSEDDAYMDKYIVCQTGDENSDDMVNFAVIKVYYDPEAGIGGGNVDILSFAYPDYAKNCYIRKMTEAEDGADENGMFWQCAQNLYSPDGNYEIYELKYGANYSMMSMLKCTVPFDDAWLLNEDDESWLTYEANGGMLSIYMLEEDDYPLERKEGALIFVDRSAGYPMPKFAVVCIFDPSVK